MKNAIIIGATSGIGKELAEILSQNNHVVGLAGRRANLLTELRNNLPKKSFIRHIDVSQSSEAMIYLKKLLSEFIVTLPVKQSCNPCFGA